MKRVGIIGTGSYLPEKVLSNFEMEKFLDTSDEWIMTRTGIRERRVAKASEAASDLAQVACKRALAAAGMTAEAIELIVMATITPDTHCPAGANWLEAKLGAKHAVSFDVTAACTGFIFALSVAEQYIKTGVYRNALVVASEIMTRTLDWTDRETCILWGDGAGAVVIAEVEDGKGILSTHLHSDGAGGDNLLMPGGGSKTTPISYKSVDKKLHTLNMIGANQSFKVAVKRFAEVCEEALAHNNVTLDDIKIIVPHQANLRILQGVAKRLDVPMDKIYVNIERYGNISSATVPIALDEAVKDGTIQPGDLVLLAAFGGGLTWGSSLIRW
ncbi:MAG: 3-oxoacyl-ACP synthase [Deltaproteobacteria bacterium RBG_16_54_18]|nr:MAG: 3-oxoacyl-ACP synthase [Deltaproteobacteria bacterium RBG_16_54_18]